VIAEEMKKEIDRMNYEDMLRLWRFAPAGDPMFKGEVGEYYRETMKRKKSALAAGDRVRASKSVGW